MVKATELFERWVKKIKVAIETKDQTILDAVMREMDEIPGSGCRDNSKEMVRACVAHIKYPNGGYLKTVIKNLENYIR